VWENIFQGAESQISARQELADRLSTHDKLRVGAEYNTGSMSLDAMVALFSVAYFFKPKVIAEVGTFIGNSTFALVEGAENDCEMHTCDYSNNIDLSHHIHANPLVQYPKTPSSTMFQKMLDTGKKVDLFFIDGRLVPGEFPLIEKLSKNTTVFALDDFEGVEKGVANAGLFLSHPWTKVSYHMVYPPKDMNCNVALLVPRKLVEWTDQ
jgi:predicted O-methyltransferase YrrM